jgi:hypothetical protein
MNDLLLAISNRSVSENEQEDVAGGGGGGMAAVHVFADDEDAHDNDHVFSRPPLCYAAHSAIALCEINNTNDDAAATCYCSTARYLRVCT